MPGSLLPAYNSGVPPRPTNRLSIGIGRVEHPAGFVGAAEIAIAGERAEIPFRIAEDDVREEIDGVRHEGASARRAIADDEQPAVPSRGRQPDLQADRRVARCVAVAS